MKRTDNGLEARPAGSKDRLADRRAALRRAVTELGDVTSRFRERAADTGSDAGAPTFTPLPTPPAKSTAKSPEPAAEPEPARAVPRAASPRPLSTAPQTGASAQRDQTLAEARQRFESASRQADALVRSIAEAVESETRAFQANVEATVESRWREVETEAQRYMRKARSEAEALVDQRRHRIAEVSDRILELGETLAGRLADADEVKGQFDVFVASLSEAADRLATLPQSDEAAAPSPLSPISSRAAERPAKGLAEAA